MNTPAEWERLRTLFHRALALPAEERIAFVRREAAADEDTCREVESLLAAHPEAEGFLSDSPALPRDVDVATGDGRFRPGTRLGAFEILGPLGAGGMGEVHRARDTRLDREVAIKVLSRDLAADPRGRERFEREARAVSRLTHPHICTLYDVGSADVDGNDARFLVMELVEGETLAHRLRRGPLPLVQAMQAAVEILDALAAAHAIGIVHRDLKPANIMLTKGGVKLLDFGLARLREPAAADGGTAADSAEPLTVPGLVIGTVPYMAPEQVRGGEADARTDLFAFGAVFYEMLTGRRAFSASSEPALMASILEQDPPSVRLHQPLASPALERLVAACLAKDPSERWQHARDLSLALRGLAEGRVSSDASVGRAGVHWFDRSWRLHAAWAIVAIVLGLAVWVLASGQREVGPPANPQPVVVLMDSPLEGRVYDPRTLAAGGTNADDITDALRDLPIVTAKENTSPMWHREEQVRSQNPDLVVSHLSCLLDQRVGSDPSVGDHLFNVAQSRLTGFFGYLATTNPHTKFLVYSRGRLWPTPETEQAWTADVVSRFPQLTGRLFTMVIPGGAKASFRDATTAQRLRARVEEILALP